MVCLIRVFPFNGFGCGSRKYPYPHHRGNWKFRRGRGVKDPGHSRGERGCMIKLVSRGIPEVL